MSSAEQQGELRVLSRWFDKKQESGPAAPGPGLTGPKVPRHSGGWGALRKRLEAESSLHTIDVGYTSPANSVFMADIVRDAYSENWQTGTDEDGNPIWDVEGFLAHALNFSGRMFDVVLLWTTLDYLPEPLVAPVAKRLFEATYPGGQVLAFFHTRTHGDETVHCRFHLTAIDEVEMQLAQQVPIQRAFTNRSIERLFAGWSGYRQFLAKDGVTELIITR
jgi:hypothetical protein